MVKPAHPLVKSTAALVFAAPVVLLSACSPPGQVPSDVPGTTPAIWTGSSAPSAAADGHGAPEHATATEGAGESGLAVPLKAADGTEVATATFVFEPGYATVTIETTGAGKLTPGFHGVHIHSVGKCEPNSVAPAGGAPGDFLSAGGHLQVAGHTGHPASGDLSSLQVRQDGSGKLVTTTDAFTEEDLMSGQHTAIIIHADADNFDNIPPARYTQSNGAPGPDETTMSTGDAGKRVACGVVTGS